MEPDETSDQLRRPNLAYDQALYLAKCILASGCLPSWFFPLETHDQQQLLEESRGYLLEALGECDRWLVGQAEGSQRTEHLRPSWTMQLN